MKCCKAVSPENQKKALINFLDGLLSLIKDFEIWSEINYKSLPGVPEEEKDLTPIQDILPQEGSVQRGGNGDQIKLSIKKEATSVERVLDS